MELGHTISNMIKKKKLVLTSSLKPGAPPSTFQKPPGCFWVVTEKSGHSTGAHTCLQLNKYSGENSKKGQQAWHTSSLVLASQRLSMTQMCWHEEVGQI
uniref:Uncharacterized protein n=1 Tax=Pyxicephalus adspersus TaxID=30357 RepID=A0AAV3AS23_PYXAD|nr:TPA: hypothetical protein GDO54_001769 [Pyxicephalus adspersus]